MSGVGSFIQRYGTLVTLLVPIKDTVFGLSGAPCTIRFQMVVRGLLTPLLWRDQEIEASGT